MNPRLGLFIFTLCVAAHLPAMTINTRSISGDADSINASFEINWGANLEGSNNLNGLVNGDWAGGNWQFQFGVGGMPSRGQEAYNTMTFRTSWSDGWIPGGLSYYQCFDYGSSGSGTIAENIPYDRSPQFAYDYSGLGLEYYLDLGALLKYDRGADFSGTEIVTYSLVRRSANTAANASVPEGSATFILFGGALAGIAMLRRRVASAVVKCE